MFTRLDIRKERDPNIVKIFYSQSFSVVKFLSKRYGSSAFQKLCRILREGKDFETALKRAYTGKIKNFSELEKQWFQYIKK